MSGRKNFLPPFTIITAGDMSQASLTSTIVNIQYLDNICISFVFSGSPVGTFSIEGSNTYNQTPEGSITSVGTWTPIVLNPVAIAAGTSGSVLLDLNQLSFPWIRAIYTKTSGTGTLTATISGKML